MINAAKMSEMSTNIEADAKGAAVGRKGTEGVAEVDRIRKERSESTSSPGANLLQAGMEDAQGAGEVKGKRAKV